MIGLRLTCYVLNEFSNGGVISQRTPSRLHVRQLGNKLFNLSNSFCIVSLLAQRQEHQIINGKH